MDKHYIALQLLKELDQNLENEELTTDFLFFPKGETSSNILRWLDASFEWNGNIPSTTGSEHVLDWALFDENGPLRDTFGNVLLFDNWADAQKAATLQNRIIPVTREHGQLISYEPEANFKPKAVLV